MWISFWNILPSLWLLGFDVAQHKETPSVPELCVPGRAQPGYKSVTLHFTFCVLLNDLLKINAGWLRGTGSVVEKLTRPQPELWSLWLLRPVKQNFFCFVLKKKKDGKGGQGKVSLAGFSVLKCSCKMLYWGNAAWSYLPKEQGCSHPNIKMYSMCYQNIFNIFYLQLHFHGKLLF